MTNGFPFPGIQSPLPIEIKFPDESKQAAPAGVPELGSPVNLVAPDALSVVNDPAFGVVPPHIGGVAALAVARSPSPVILEAGRGGMTSGDRSPLPLVSTTVLFPEIPTGNPVPNVDPAVSFQVGIYPLIVEDGPVSPQGATLQFPFTTAAQ